MVPSDGSRHAKDKRNCVHFPWLQSRKMEFLETNIETIREFVKENKTHKQISKILLEAFPLFLRLKEAFRKGTLDCSVQTMESKDYLKPRLITLLLDALER